MFPTEKEMWYLNFERGRFTVKTEGAILWEKTSEKHTQGLFERFHQFNIFNLFLVVHVYQKKLTLVVSRNTTKSNIPILEQEMLFASI